MTQRETHWIIGLGSALFAVLCVAFLPRFVVAILLACAASVIGIAVERERRLHHGQ